MASSSSPMRKKIYDVFISFRGEDTRYGFTAYLHEALRKRRIKTYIDEEDLSRGRRISPALLEAIESSLLSVIVFSANYASSSWCLDELLHILECNDKLQQLVIPVFYHIEPSHVRKELGSYKEAFDNHLQRFNEDSEKVENWRLALNRAANLSGFSTQDCRFKSEPKLVEAIVEDIIKKLNDASSFFVGAENLVGIEQSICEIETLLQIGSSDIRVVGIWGRGGIGKTTLARFMFWRLSTFFEGHCFLENVREEWEKHRAKSYIQNMLFSSVLVEKDMDLTTGFGLPTFVMDRLGRTKSLIVLDDLNEKEQLESLVGCCKRFGLGSRIIVTSRDVQCLPTHLVNAVYEVKGLSSNDARRLFCLNASNENFTYPTELLERVVKYAEGVPLVLNVLRSCFSPNGRENWETLLDKVKSSRGGENIRNALMISYNDLSKRQKDVFLDIACFFKGWNRHKVESILKDQGFFVDLAIDDLVDKSLITISFRGQLCMHDLVQEMAQEVIHEQSSKTRERSRLWDAREIYHVLKNNRASEQIEGIFFDVSKMKQVVRLSHDVFESAYNLRLLKIYNSNNCKEMNVHLPEGLSSLPDSLRYLDWPSYSSKSFPSSFAPEMLVHLNMTNSQVQLLWDGIQNLGSLQSLNLSHSKNLIEIPDLSEAPNLETIDLSCCSSLLNVPSHKFRNLGKLRDLRMRKCVKLQALPDIIEAAEYLSLQGCINLKNMPEIKNENVFVMDLSGSVITELPNSIGSFNKMSEMCLNNCKNLKNLPSTICQLKLKRLCLSGCSSLEKIPELLPATLLELSIEKTAIEEIPSSSIESLSLLSVLSLRNCTRLRKLPTNICKLKSLRCLYLSGCSNFEDFPEILEPMEDLWELDLSETSIRTLPSSIENLVSLDTLDLTSCENLELDFSADSYFSEIPHSWLDGMKSITSLHIRMQSLDEIPASITKFSNLNALYISQWNNLQSLPELPFDLDVLDAEGCTSLVKVSSSRNIILQGFHDQNSYPNHRCVSFFNCLKLDQNSRDNIIADGQLRILRNAVHATSPYFRKIADVPCDSCICYPGSEIPEWFILQETGPSITIKLSPNWSKKFLGFSLCFVTAFEDYNVNIAELLFKVDFHYVTKYGERCKCYQHLCWVPPIQFGKCKERFTNSDHVFMGLKFNNLSRMDKAEQDSITGVSFHLLPVLGFSSQPVESRKVKRCGIRMLYLEDVEKLGVSIHFETLYNNQEEDEEEDFPIEENEDFQRSKKRKTDGNVAHTLE